jgi:hypothetical protein
MAIRKIFKTDVFEFSIYRDQSKLQKHRQTIQQDSYQMEDSKKKKTPASLYIKTLVCWIKKA